MSVVEHLREAAPGVLEDEPVVFAYLFGSQATGQAHPRSDVDVAVMLDETVPEDERLETSLRLARRLSEASGLGRIEVVLLNDAPLPLVGRAISTRQVIYSKDEPARVEFESRRHREFLDFQIHAEPLARALLRRAAGER
ncbi:MAG TPA: nucleotidyltransferase domain-containing protein [Actinomycetota bacterium]